MGLNVLISALHEASTNDDIEGLFIESNGLSGAPASFFELRKALSESTALLAVVHGDEYEENISRQISRNTDVLSVPPEPASCAAVCAPMTLDEAIEHAESRVNETPCGQAHAQLAAWLRELRAFRKTPANVAAMREALEEIARWDDGIGADISNIARAALAAPARNCDVGTAEEQAERFKAFCDNYHTCSCCPLNFTDDITACPIEWSQMPFAQKKGDAK